MDGFAFHPYGESSSTPPDFAHPRSTSIGLADYDKLVALLGAAFDGTAQVGSRIPIVYDEYGIDSLVPARKSSLYHGIEPATTHPVPEAVQAERYSQAMLMAACQPTVRGFLIFHVTDEPDYNRWQSGLYYPDGAPKTSRAAVKQTILQVHEHAVDCSTSGTPNPDWEVVSSTPEEVPTAKPKPKTQKGPRSYNPAAAWVVVKPF